MSNDEFELHLSDRLQRAADPVSTTAPVGGRDLIERRMRQRAARRKRNLGIGAAAAVVVLGGGVLALRPDPPTRVKFGAGLAGPSNASAVATGYATGSMSGSPTGWSHPQVDPNAVALPKVVADVDVSWVPSGVFAQTSNRGSGTAAAPIAVLADGAAKQPTFIVASVQTPSTLGPGSGGSPISADGLTGRVLSDHSPNRVVVIVDLPGGHRVQATGVGVDRATLLERLATLHQDQGAWVMDGTEGLAPVAVPIPTTSTSREVSWEQPPAGASLSAGNPTAGMSVTVTTGGAYEFYAQAAMADAGSISATVAASIFPGRHLVATISSTNANDVETLLLDDQGLVISISQWSGGDVAPASGGSTVAHTPAPVSLSVASDAQWAAMVEAAALNQAAQEQAAIAQKQGLGRQAEAGTAGSTIPPAIVVPNSSVVDTNTTTTVGDPATTTTVSATPATTTSGA